MKEKNSSLETFKYIFLREKRTVSLVVMLVILFVAMSCLNSRNFPTIANMRSMMSQMAETGLFTLAMFIIMISGGLNLSIVAVANLSAAGMASITTGMIFKDVFTSDAQRIIAGILFAVLIGVACGVINGLFVSKLGLNALLVTTASAQLFEGGAQLISKGGSIVNEIPEIVAFGNTSLFGNAVPKIFIVTIVCYIVAAIFANKTKYGENSRLLGANGTANIYCGNNNVRTLMSAYILSGIFSAFGGMLVFAKMGIVRSEYGGTLSSQALLTLVLAGLLVIGGTGKVINVLLSLAILQVVSSGLNLAGITTYMRSVV
ncbi:MAG: ABC transporter permease, partial [Oscillospiraceae bacterium]